MTCLKARVGFRKTAPFTIIQRFCKPESLHEPDAGPRHAELIARQPAEPVPRVLPANVCSSALGMEHAGYVSLCHFTDASITAWAGSALCTWPVIMAAWSLPLLVVAGILLATRAPAAEATKLLLTYPGSRTLLVRARNLLFRMESEQPAAAGIIPLPSSLL